MMQTFRILCAWFHIYRVWGATHTPCSPPPPKKKLVLSGSSLVFPPPGLSCTRADVSFVLLLFADPKSSKSFSS